MHRLDKLGLENLETRLNLTGLCFGMNTHPIARPTSADQITSNTQVISLTSIAQEKARAISIGTVIPDALVTPSVRPGTGTNSTPSSPPVTPATGTDSSGDGSGTSSSDDTTTTVSQSEQATPATPDPLAPILAQLYGDGIHDDSGTIQNLIDTANQIGDKTITLPAGNFLLAHMVDFYGTGITLTGQGDKTMLLIDNHYMGYGTDKGWGIAIQPTFDPTIYMATQAVTGNTITLSGQVNFQPGQMLFLNNGRGSDAAEEISAGGSAAIASNFNELAPDEYVTVASTSVNAQGNTVVQLTSNVIGTGDYTNVAPSGTSPSESYVNVRTLQNAADHLTLENFSMSFVDPQAYSAFFAVYTTNFTAQNIKISGVNSAMGGNIDVVGSMNATFQDITASVGISFNSSRNVTVANNTLWCITIEEATTNSVFRDNTITSNYLGVRVNDLLCANDTFASNTFNASDTQNGTIAIAEGTNITITDNIIKNNGINANIWLGTTVGCVITDNQTSQITNFSPLGPTTIEGNTWSPD